MFNGVSKPKYISSVYKTSNVARVPHEGAWQAVFKLESVQTFVYIFQRGSIETSNRRIFF